jgi:acyl-CoA hydrolase
MPQAISIAEAVGLFNPGSSVYVPGCGGEPVALASALEANPDRAAGVTFFGVWVPGVNRFDYAALHPEARSMAFFVAPEFRDSFMTGHLRFYPLPYTGIYGLLAHRLPCDIAILHVARPDSSGRCSLGVAADFTPGVWGNAKIKIGLINSRMPRTRSPSIPYEALDYAVEIDCPLVEYPRSQPDAVTHRIASQVALQIEDGNTLQIGLGALPSAVLAALKDHRHLRFHSGMISEVVGELLDSGAIATGDSIKTGIALGSEQFYQRIAAEQSVSFHPVPITHGFDQLSRLTNFVSINSAVSVDLFGQINSEMIGRRQISGTGGSTDFIRGAIASPGGRAIIALPSKAKETASRIVVTHPAGTAIGSPRGEGVILVTEHGIADLRDLSIDAKAEALIAVADPKFQTQLTEQWRELRRSM